MKNTSNIQILLIFISIIILIIYYIIKHYNKNISKQTSDNNYHLPDKYNFINNIVSVPINTGMIQNLCENFENHNHNNKQLLQTCLSPPDLFFIYLNTKHLEQVLYRPIPIWTNDIFCVYKTKPILSLNQDLNNDEAVEDDYYYPLGDVILFKDYSNYLKNYKKNTELICQNQNNNQQNNKNNKNNQQSKNNQNNQNKQQSNNNQNNQNNNQQNEEDNNIYSKYKLKGDNYIKNYDQMGIKGLKILVKGGKKPVGFSENPIASIPKENGETLWLWEPIAPEGYSFLGHHTTISPNPTMPLLDNVNIRAVPNVCIRELNLEKTDIVISEDIKIPNRIYLTSNGKYFKGEKIMHINKNTNIRSQDLYKNCLKFEVDEDDKVYYYMFLFKNTQNNDGTMNDLDTFTFNLFKYDFVKHFENILLQNAEFLLNNFTNNPDDYTFESDQKRYKTEAKLFNKNIIGLKLKINKRKYGYNELGSKNLFDVFNKFKSNNSLNLNLRHNSLIYNFICDKMSAVEIVDDNIEETDIPFSEESINEGTDDIISLKKDDVSINSNTTGNPPASNDNNNSMTPQQDLTRSSSDIFLTEEDIINLS